MTKRLVTLIVMLCASLPAVAQMAHDTTLANQGQLWLPASQAYASTYTADATTWHYGTVVEMKTATDVNVMVTAAGTGATTFLAVALEWLPTDPRDPDANGPWAAVSYSDPATGAGDAITGMYAWREVLTLLKDGALPTTVSGLTRVAAASSTTTLYQNALNAAATGYKIVSAGNFVASTQVKAPYCRVVVYYAVASATPAYPTAGRATVWVQPRVRSYRQTPVGEIEYLVTD